MARRVSPTVMAQYTAALKERDELQAARVRDREAMKSLNESLMAALRQVRELEHKVSELERLAEGRKQVAMEARRALTRARKGFFDIQAHVANDKELIEASHAAA